MKIYFMGICGTAMGNAALLARAAGHHVIGSDSGIYPPMSDVLAQADIEVFDGYSADRLGELNPDLVVIGNAMSRGHEEVEWLLETRAIPITSLPALLADTVLAARKNIVIAGTHGKTTTTALTAFLLRANHNDPGFLIGGVPLDPPVGQHLGSSEAPFVIEGDEYDSAFFDKRSKFIHYAPHIAVLNNLEFDHADIFRDLIDVQRTFRHLTRIVPRNGFILLNGDDPNLAEFTDCIWTQVLKVGTGETNDLRVIDFSESPDGTHFTLVWKGEFWARIRWSQPGLFNARNAAMAALAAGLAMNSDDPTALSLESLQEFRGVKRRQEIKLDQTDLTVIEDFGHHPSALAATLESLRSRYPDSTITAVFEPRSNSARSQVHQEGFISALSRAHRVYLGAIARAELMAEDKRFNVSLVINALEDRGISAQTAPSNLELLSALASAPVKAGDHNVVVFFTNGSFDGIIEKFVAAKRS
ncbi:MAG: UDP-N-acetylmuramate:L-alanyl-gamma-D-glutamyl-meso-diaminopimelate ligase [Synoicihabitans sp.]